MITASIHSYNDISLDNLRVMLAVPVIKKPGLNYAYIDSLLESGVVREITGRGYKRKKVKNLRMQIHTGSVSLHCDDIIWKISSFGARYAFFYSESTRKILCSWDFGGIIYARNSDYKLVINEEGLLSMNYGNW